MASPTRGRTSKDATDPSLETHSEAGQAPLQDAAGEIVDQATRTADAKASTAMTQVGDALDQVAQAAHGAATSLRQERPEVAGVVDTAATKTEEAARYLREHNAREVIGTAEGFARKQPALVIAGGLAVGFVAARFLRSAGGPSSSSASRYSGSRSGSDWYDVGADPSGPSSLGTRPYTMGMTTASGSRARSGNGSGSSDAYRLAESGE